MDKTNAFDVIDREIEGLLSKQLNPNSVDLLFKLTSVRTHLENALNTSNNGEYNRNINELLDKYIASRKIGETVGIIEALTDLLGELSDLVIEIHDSARTESERNLITDFLENLSIRI